MGSYLLAPHLALKAALQQPKCLLVFDDVLLHQMKERMAYDLADQPFAPQNIINQIATFTGSFPGRQLTSILIVDTEGKTLTFQRDEDLLISHIASVSDHIIDF
jgi:hypothetical protein